jgi:hypothetical protein
MEDSLKLNLYIVLFDCPYLWLLNFDQKAYKVIKLGANCLVFY